MKYNHNALVTLNEEVHRNWELDNKEQVIGNNFAVTSLSVILWTRANKVWAPV